MHDIWNPWHGCVECSEGCGHCYMYFLDRMRNRNGADIYRTKAGLHIRCRNIGMENIRYGGFPFQETQGEREAVPQACGLRNGLFGRKDSVHFPQRGGSQHGDLKPKAAGASGLCQMPPAAFFFGGNRVHTDLAFLYEKK